MPTMYVSWHKFHRRPVDGMVMQIEGPFISSEDVDITTAHATSAAPDGAEYATVWADVPFYFKKGTGAAADNTSKPYPANAPVQVVYVDPGVTVISGSGTLMRMGLGLGFAPIVPSAPSTSSSQVLSADGTGVTWGDNTNVDWSAS